MITVKPTILPGDLIAYRTSLGMDQHAFAELIGVTWQAIRLWELGERRVPETTVRLIRLFKKWPQLAKEF